MCTQEQQQRHKRIFDWFEEKRKKDGLYYSVRRNNRNDRLQQGYIFLGNDDFVVVPLVAHYDSVNFTPSISFFFREGNWRRDDVPRCYLEFVSRNCAHGGNDVEFYEKMMEFDKKFKNMSKTMKMPKLRKFGVSQTRKNIGASCFSKGGIMKKPFLIKRSPFGRNTGSRFGKTISKVRKRLEAI